MANQVGTVRPLNSIDLESYRRFGKSLTQETIYKRFFSSLILPSEQIEKNLLHKIDHQNVEALAYWRDDAICGVARYTRVGNNADIAVVVGDEWQRQGIGRLLLSELRDLARAQGIEFFSATALSDNRAIIALLKEVFAEISFKVRGTECEIHITL